jgi:hypothetical protein
MVSFYILPMNFRHLITQSTSHYERQSNKIENVFSFNVFNNGAKWMYEKLKYLEPQNKITLSPNINFNRYGYLKYGICLTIWAISLFLLLKLNIYFTPISILVFYFCEVHFLFLFPLLIDDVKNPILTSIKQTYKIGILETTFTVSQIGIFMVLGLLNFKNPFKNWYIGCFAILIWYQNEVRNRL